MSGCATGPGAVARPSASTSSSTSPTSSTSSTSSASPRDPGLYAARIVVATNAVRAAHSLAKLDASTCARKAALQRASDLVGAAELAHAPLAGVIARCKSDTTAAENLSSAAATPEAVVDAWMGSPGHRANLLDPALTEIGVGCVLDGAAMLCSQVFLGP